VDNIGIGAPDSVTVSYNAFNAYERTDAAWDGWMARKKEKSFCSDEVTCIILCRCRQSVVGACHPFLVFFPPFASDSLFGMTPMCCPASISLQHVHHLSAEYERR
jgi:hypothetical protein